MTSAECSSSGATRRGIQAGGFEAEHLHSISSAMVRLRLRLRPQHRLALSESVRELANLLAGGLVLAQLVGTTPPSWWLIVGGVAGWLTLIAFALKLLGEDDV